jgi:NhaP-type Na+/H+ or K+/H+ antiporter
LRLAGVSAGYAAKVFRVRIGRLRDATLSVIASFLAAWAAYIGGEAIHVSGVLSTVACGLVMGWRQHTVLSAVTRTQAFAVWKVVGFVVASGKRLEFGVARSPVT